MMSWLKALNRRRLFWKRLRVVKKDDLPQRNPLTRPERVKRLLVIDAFPGFGDAVYTNGLLSALMRDGLEVSVAAREKMLSVFRTMRSRRSMRWSLSPTGKRVWRRTLTW